MTQPASQRKPKIVSIENGKAIKPFGLDMKILIDSEETGGQFSAILAVHQPGQGPLPHRHAHQDEYFFVVEGEYDVVINGEPPVKCGPGTLLFLPAGHTHGFKNVGTTPAKMIDWSLPGGQEKYFQEISDLQAGAGFTGNKMDEVNRKHHTEYFK